LNVLIGGSATKKVNEVKNNMCKNCGCSMGDKPVQYQCTCSEDCECAIIEFDTEPNAIPYCCGQPMKKIK
jgi:hypothetical protein